MFQYVTTSQRKNTSRDFYFFQTDDLELATYQNKVRHDLMNAPGFISFSIEVSEDKLTMTLKITWENREAAERFSSSNNSKFEKLLKKYLDNIGHMNRTRMEYLADPPEIKKRKLAREATSEEIASIMRNIIDNNKNA